MYVLYHVPVQESLHQTHNIDYDDDKAGPGWKLFAA